MKKVIYTVAIMATLSLAACGSKQHAEDTTNAQEAVVVEEEVVSVDTMTPAEHAEAATEEVAAGAEQAGEAASETFDDAKQKGKEAVDAAKKKGKEAVDAATKKGKEVVKDAKTKAADAMQKGAENLRK